jgi:hypothetical protein
VFTFDAAGAKSSILGFCLKTEGACPAGAVLRRAAN